MKCVIDTFFCLPCGPQSDFFLVIPRSLSIDLDIKRINTRSLNVFGAGRMCLWCCDSLRVEVTEEAGESFTVLYHVESHTT